MFTAVVAGSALLLAACGGGGGSGSDGGLPGAPTPIEQLRIMESYYTNQGRLNARAAQEGTLTMPTSGTASYEGVAKHYHRPDPAGRTGHPDSHDEYSLNAVMVSSPPRVLPD